MKELFFPAQPKKGQEEYYAALQDKQIVFVTGHAGSGKTFLAVSEAVKHLFNPKSNIKKICIIRPYRFSTSEKIGALPGTLEEKINPFIESIRDNLEMLINDNKTINEILDKSVEPLTLSTLRGRSLHNAFIIVEETQNISLQDDGILLILTRLGKNSRIVFTGDVQQADIPSEQMAIFEAINALQNTDCVKHIELDGVENNYRNPVIGKILKAFQDFRKEQY